MKIMAEVRCPIRAYEESMTKKEIKARLLELGYEVTLRPRKSTLLALLEKAEVMEEAKKICKPEPKINGLMAHLTLILCGAFFIMLGLEVVNFYTLELPFVEFISLTAMFFMIIGIPLWVLWMEFKRG